VGIGAVNAKGSIITWPTGDGATAAAAAAAGRFPRAARR